MGLVIYYGIRLNHRHSTQPLLGRARGGPGAGRALRPSGGGGNNVSFVKTC